MEWLFSFLFYCETDINQYAGQKTFRDTFGARLLLSSVALETLCCHSIKECFFAFLWEGDIFLLRQFLYHFFCIIYGKEDIFICKIKGAAAHCSLFPKPFIGMPCSKELLARPKFSNYIEARCNILGWRQNKSFA